MPTALRMNRRLSPMLSRSLRSLRFQHAIFSHLRSRSLIAQWRVSLGLRSRNQTRLLHIGRTTLTSFCPFVATTLLAKKNG